MESYETNIKRLVKRCTMHNMNVSATGIRLRVVKRSMNIRSWVKVDGVNAVNYFSV